MVQLRLRYSLRALLVAVAVVGVWCAFHSSRARFERRVERAVLAAGGRITCGPLNFDDPAKPPPRKGYSQLVQAVFGEREITAVDLSFHPIAGELLEDVSKLPYLESFVANRAQVSNSQLACVLENKRLKRLYVAENPAISDAGSESIGLLTSLRFLHLDDAKITDKTLSAILSLPQLEQVTLSRTKIEGRNVGNISGAPSLRTFHAEKCQLADGFIRCLAKCERLEVAYLDGTGIGDYGVQSFKGHPALHRLVLPNNRITDASLQILTECPKLKYLSVGNNRLTREGVAAFRKARPDVELR